MLTFGGIRILPVLVKPSFESRGRFSRGVLPPSAVQIQRSIPEAKINDQVINHDTWSPDLVSSVSDCYKRSSDRRD